MSEKYLIYQRHVAFVLISLDNQLHDERKK